MLKGDNAVTRWPTKEKRIDFSILLFLSGKRDSNSRPSAWEADALPTELFPQCERKDTRKKRRNQISGEKKLQAHL